MSEKKEMQPTVMLSVSKIEINTGQIDGLPKNPRFIRNEKFEKLRQSIQDAPEMLEMRSLIVVAKGKKYVVICGNMRLRACLDLGYKELPCYILPEDTPAKKLREYTIKDNIGYGQNDWDILANEWDTAELEDWGLDIVFPSHVEDIDNLFEDIENQGEKDNALKIVVEVRDENQELYDEVLSAVKEAVSSFENVKVV